MRRPHSLPPEVYALVDQTPGTVLLEGRSALHARNNDGPNEEPWTRLFTAPFRVCAAYAAAEIPRLFAAVEEAVAEGHTAAGFFSYECGACFEPTAKMHRSPEYPLAWIGLYERSYPFDHRKGEFADGEPPELERLREAMRGGVKTDGTASAEVEAEFALTPKKYAERIAAIHEWIRAGDVYQLNFTAPWRVKIGEGKIGEGKASGGTAGFYEKLRAQQPVDYGAFVHWKPGRRILSFSPELFFRVDEEDGKRSITSRPMKGTAPRGRTIAEDLKNADWLRNDAKNHSENLMIVDLVRNDVGRLARFGSVRATKLFATERYAMLWQMTSTVSGELRPEVGFEDIFRALFPCGSITGAPKVRAMQLIAGMEGQPRGVYTGAIGFFSAQQTVFNVAIRTLDMDADCGVMGAGSGIVIDSDAAAEYREVMLKAKFLRSALQRPVRPSLPGGFSLIESLLWDGGFQLIELHLDRLVDSAEYFDFPCNRDEIRATLEDYSLGFASGAARKVRLLLDGEGSMRITDEILAAPSGEERIGRVRVAQERTDSCDPMFFHKTTQRALYTRAFKDAAEAGFDDVLFLNERGEVTEGAISNVFVEKKGRLQTPPIECGLLAGVYRRHLLTMRPEIEQCVILLDDLRTADAVYLANAVRGLRRVRIEAKSGM